MSSIQRTYSIRDEGDGRRLARFGQLAGISAIAHAVTPKGVWLLPADLSVSEHSHRCDALAREIGLESAAWLSQVHGNRVFKAINSGLLGEGDALVCDRPGLGIIVRGADCPLVLAVAEGDRGLAVGAAHASWRGTVARTTQKMLEALLELCDGKADSVVAAIAPSAGPCCYEVGEEVREKALAELGSEAASFFETRDGSLYFDLWSANRAQLEEAGCDPAGISMASRCTMCHTEDYPSWRVEKQAAGRMAAIIGIRA